MDNYLIPRAKVNKAMPGSIHSQYVRYFPMLNDKDENKWDIHQRILKYLVLWFNAMKDEILYLANRRPQILYKFYDDKLIEDMFTNHDTVIGEMESVKPPKNTKKFIKGEIKRWQDYVCPTYEKS